jgi:hypothetical protein
MEPSIQVSHAVNPRFTNLHLTNHPFILAGQVVYMLAVVPAVRCTLRHGLSCMPDLQPHGTPDLPQKPTAAQPFTRLSAFCGHRSIIAVFTRAISQLDESILFL